MQEVQDCVEAMAQLFNPGDPAGTSPSHLISVLKAALRQMAIGNNIVKRAKSVFKKNVSFIYLFFN